MSVSICRITDADIPAVVELLYEFAEYENLSEYCEVTIEKLRAAMHYNGGCVEGLVGYDGSDAVAFALFYPGFSSFRGERSLYLEDIYIRENYRRADLGESMLREIAKIAASRGFTRIDFNVHVWNAPAIKFYEKFGAVRNEDERHFKFSDESFRRLVEN